MGAYIGHKCDLRVQGLGRKNVNTISNYSTRTISALNPKPENRIDYVRKNRILNPKPQDSKHPTESGTRRGSSNQALHICIFRGFIL